MEILVSEYLNMKNVTGILTHINGLNIFLITNLV
jgi:hypothetical protein